MKILFDFYLAPSLTFPVSAPLKWGSWQPPKVFSSSIVCKPEIKNDKPGTKLVLAATLSKEMGKKFIAHAWRGGSARCFSHTFKYPQISVGRHGIEKKTSLPAALGLKISSTDGCLRISCTKQNLPFVHAESFWLLTQQGVCSSLARPLVL